MKCYNCRQKIARPLMRWVLNSNWYCGECYRVIHRAKTVQRLTAMGVPQEAIKPPRNREYFLYDRPEDGK